MSRKLLPLLLTLLFLIHGVGYGLGSQLTPEQRASNYLESIRSTPPELYAFLSEMPKGADLHSHLSGAIYAESFVQWAAQANLCLDQKTVGLSSSPCDESAGRIPVSAALKDPVLYRRVIDSWSMRNWELSGQSGHDHFFDAFAKFGPAGNGHTGDMIAEAAARAAQDRVSYLELMLTPDGSQARQVGAKTGWDDNLANLRNKLLSSGIGDAVTNARHNLDAAETDERKALRCNASDPDPGCKVAVRYIYSVSRGGSPEQVFAQILTGFELASADSRVVGLNLVQAEDWFVPMRDFSLHMRMLEYLHSRYPKIHIALHAGELVQGLVPPEGLRFHIRESIGRGHAERIGHGVDIMHEDYALSLLKEMAARSIMVEVCLTSNDVTLGVRGKEHPLATYLKYQVPVALATDDEGVSRSNMTQEFVKAVREQSVSYVQLKNMARNSLEHAFIDGASLWKSPRSYDRAAPCSTDRPGTQRLSASCSQLLQRSEKARLQWHLEEEFYSFEAKKR